MSTSRFIPLALAILLITACAGGDERAVAQAAVTTTTAQASGANGASLYQQRCSSCHQTNGQGSPGVYPPLAGSEFVLARDTGVPARIVIHGIQGPLTVKGQQYNSLMPAYGLGITMSDAEVAAVLTYIRSSWGNAASAVTAADVAKAREATAGHSGAMTAELLRPLM